MIGKLTGIVDSINEEACILDVGGVGYVIYCPLRVLFELKVGQAHSFVTYMLVKEDQLTLFGFNNKEEKECFLHLQTVQGVGAKMALAVLNSLSPNKVSLALMAEDVNAFKQVNGIGAKLASRIVNELKSKSHIFGAWLHASVSSSDISVATVGTTAAAVKAVSGGAILNDALSALANLGFGRSEVFPVISNIYAANENIELDELIRSALSQLSRPSK